LQQSFKTMRVLIAPCSVRTLAEVAIGVTTPSLPAPPI
jgi:3-polyprenyl-4-hydroxybenzoate decarboxylase